MSEDLLSYYNRELSLIRRLGGEFAEAHPNVAERLRFNAETCDDPHVERLIESFAFLTSHIKKTLDDEFADLPTALLNLLHPHYLQPIPSMSIFEFEIDAEKAGLTARYDIARGQLIDTEPVSGTTCTFRTCYPVSAWPIRVAEASFSPPELLPAGVEPPRKAESMIRIRLESQLKDVAFEDLPIDQLRFFLYGERQIVNLLYEFLFTRALRIAVVPDARKAPPKWLDAGRIKPVGFVRDESALPVEKRSPDGYRLITEYLAFPQKFLFFDLEDLKVSSWEQVGQGLDLYVFLDRASSDLERSVTAETFRLNCTPVVNLFEMTTDPIKLDHQSYAYRVSPNARRSGAYEVYTVDRVADAKGGIDFVPFFDIRHSSSGRKDRGYWFARRTTAEEDGRFDEKGTEVHLSFVDLGLNPAEFTSTVVEVRATCLNRDLPTGLPFGGGRPQLTVPKGAGKAASIRCLTPPTPTRRIPAGRASLWKIFSHLSLNHLSLHDESHSPSALREIIRLYDFIQSADAAAKAESIQSIAMQHQAFRVGGSMPAAFCRGVQVQIRLDPGRFSDHGAYLFAAVLNRFLALYVSINSASQLVVSTGPDEKDRWQWPPRAGEKPLL